MESDRDPSVEPGVQPPRERRSLTLTLLVFRRLDETLELYVDVDLDAQKESHFEQHQLKLPNTCNSREDFHAAVVENT